jgi:hypothetical protein
MPLVRRRRPLLRAAGAAAVGGAAYHAGKRAGTESAPPAESAYSPPAPPASTGLSSEAIEHLQELGRLREQGVLTDEEFEQQKQRYLNPH